MLNGGPLSSLQGIGCHQCMLNEGNMQYVEFHIIEMQIIKLMNLHLAVFLFCLCRELMSTNENTQTTDMTQVELIF